jgi:Asp-tRNA(Asn)/Glu-tRNA(Gln) amidotransferase A subunit family amidase
MLSRSAPTILCNPMMRSYFSATPHRMKGKGTPRTFLEECLAIIAEKESGIGAFVTMNTEAARAAADRASVRWKTGKPLSLIDGMPIGVKDIMETADMPTQQGSALFDGWRTGRDAAAVAALREAGAVVLGKTVTTEFAASEARGTRNPWDLKRTPGGSSSGSAAAVAAGMVPAALGTQVFGSILRPASFCGCYGYKPSVGAINRGGSYDNFSQSVSGVLAASLSEAWYVARAISARVGGDPGHEGLSGPLELPAARPPRAIALLRTAGWARASTAREALMEQVARLEEAGIVVRGQKSDPGIAEVEDLIADAESLSRKIVAWESRWPLNTYARDKGRDGLSRATQDRLAEAEAMTLEQYQVLLAERRRVREAYGRLAAGYDLCVTLAAPGAAPLGIEYTGDPIFTMPGSLLGVPALSLPLLHDAGLPLGLQLLGFHNADAALFAAAGVIEERLKPSASNP